jgi:hypothetical protein
MQSRLKPPPLGGKVTSGLDEAALVALFAAGGSHAPDAATMPGWLHTLQPEEHSALAGYLRSLAGPGAQD